MDELFSELEAIHGEKDKRIKELEAENKQKDDYIKELKETVESLEVEKDLAEQRIEYLLEEKRKSKNKDNYINKLETRLIKIEQILTSRSLTRAEALIILRN